MGNENTYKVKMGDRRKSLQKLLPHVPIERIRELCEIDDPLDRFTAAADVARETGATPSTIDRVEKRRFSILVQRLGSREAAAEYLFSTQPDQPDDRSYRPRHIDPVLRGAARATGQTAAAVRRGRTVTDWQHDEREARR